MARSKSKPEKRFIAPRSASGVESSAVPQDKILPGEFKRLGRHPANQISRIFVSWSPSKFLLRFVGAGRALLQIRAASLRPW
jgi:hypothetical protein